MPRLCSSLLLSLLIASSASAVTMDWTPIGNPGNPADTEVMTCCSAYIGTSGFGSVPYDYAIGTYEVTNAQYTEFLNAIAADDPNALYNAKMATTGPLGGIARAGNSGSYTYSAIAGRENNPVNYLTFFDAARFANWMNNGQPTGAQSNTTTEDGTYTLTPQGISSGLITRNHGSTIALPNENEWYKAAYYDSNTGTYFDFPAGRDAATTCTFPGPSPNTANCETQLFSQSPRRPVPVGSYGGSPSPAGTYDQGGNIFEWLDTPGEPFGDLNPKIMRGGSSHHIPEALDAAFRADSAPYVDSFIYGMRLVMIPEPGTGLLVVAGLLGLAGSRRARA